MFCTGDCPPSIAILTYICKDFSENGDWSLLAGEILFTPNSGAIGFITFNTAGPFWAVPFDTREERLSTTLSLDVRNDKPTVNASPVAYIIPDIHLANGCDHEIQIPVKDPDGDLVRCRHCLNAGECGAIFSSITLIPLNEETCTLSFSSSLPNGPIALALFVEDFLPANPIVALSKVGLQFIVHVLDGSFPCSSRPTFDASDFYADMCVGTPVNTSLTKRLIMDGLGSDLVGTELHFVSTEDISVSTISAQSGSSLAEAELYWAPDAEVLNGKICLYVISSDSVPSEWFCFDLKTNGPELNLQSLSWQEAQLTSFRTLFTANFSTGIRRPNMEAYITFVDSLEGTPLYIIDVTSERGRSEVMYNDNGLMTIFPDHELYLPNDTEISILFDAGVVLQRDCIIANNAITDRSAWTFTKTGK